MMHWWNESESDEEKKTYDEEERKKQLADKVLEEKVIELAGEKKRQLQELSELFLSFEGEKYPSNAQRFSDLYEIEAILGQGAFGQVVSALQKSNGKRVAVKIIDKRQFKKLAIELDKEAKILQHLDHPNIIKFLASHESSRCFMIVMEYFNGASLDQFISSRLSNPFSNKEVRDIIHQILLAIQHMHGQEVLHRDLKPENILIRQNENGQFQIKIIDFGLSFKNEQIGTVGDNCGTLIYMAPEVAFNRQYQRSVDLWSCGIIQFMLFSMGVHPLWQKNDSRKIYLEKLKNPQWHFPQNMSKEAKQFFSKTAALIPEDRMSVQQCLKHVWISGEGNINDPITIKDIIACFTKTQTFSVVSKAVFFLQLMKTNCIRAENTNFLAANQNKLIRIVQESNEIQQRIRQRVHSDLARSNSGSKKIIEEQADGNSSSQQQRASQRQSPVLALKYSPIERDESSDSAAPPLSNRGERKSQFVYNLKENGGCSSETRDFPTSHSTHTSVGLSIIKNDNPAAKLPRQSIELTSSTNYSLSRSPSGQLLNQLTKKPPVSHIRKYAKQRVTETSIIVNSAERLLTNELPCSSQQGLNSISYQRDSLSQCFSSQCGVDQQVSLNLPSNWNKSIGQVIYEENSSTNSPCNKIHHQIESNFQQQSIDPIFQKDSKYSEIEQFSSLQKSRNSPELSLQSNQNSRDSSNSISTPTDIIPNKVSQLRLKVNNPENEQQDNTNNPSKFKHSLSQGLQSVRKLTRQSLDESTQFFSPQVSKQTAMTTMRNQNSSNFFQAPFFQSSAKSTNNLGTQALISPRLVNSNQQSIIQKRNNNTNSIITPPPMKNTYESSRRDKASAIMQQQFLKDAQLLPGSRNGLSNNSKNEIHSGNLDKILKSEESLSEGIDSKVSSPQLDSADMRKCSTEVQPDNNMQFLIDSPQHMGKSRMQRNNNNNNQLPPRRLNKSTQAVSNECKLPAISLQNQGFSATNSRATQKGRAGGYLNSSELGPSENSPLASPNLSNGSFCLDNSILSPKLNSSSMSLKLFDKIPSSTSQQSSGTQHFKSHFFNTNSKRVPSQSPQQQQLL